MGRNFFSFLVRIDLFSRSDLATSCIAPHFNPFIYFFMFRILMMMQTVASSKNQNRMSTSAVAACMAPLLLRPLLAGECEIETDFNVGGDGSAQLLQAAAAANHAQAIVITLLEEYDKIFGVSCNDFFFVKTWVTHISCSLSCTLIFSLGILSTA